MTTDYRKEIWIQAYVAEIARESQSSKTPSMRANNALKEFDTVFGTTPLTWTGDRLAETDAAPNTIDGRKAYADGRGAYEREVFGPVHRPAGCAGQGPQPGVLCFDELPKHEQAKWIVFAAK